MATTEATTIGTPSDKDKGHDVDLAAMKKVMLDAKVDGKKSVWTTTLETFGMADGKTKKHDIMVDEMDQGLELFRAYVEEKDLCWELVPLEQFQASKDVFFLAFLSWAIKDKDKVNATTKINVSKALRRMEAYFQWMQDNRKDLEEPLTVDSIAQASKIWDIQITYDPQGQFVWWVDLGSLDREAIKNVDSKDHLRYVVWFCHLVMFDSKARQNGAMIVEDMGHLGFWKMATLMPHDLSAKMDRLTIGILPVRMKAIYVFGAATWMTLLMNLMYPFMGKKMRERMKLLPNKTDMQAFCDELVTRKNIPQGFCGIQGGAQRDAVLNSFANNK